MDQGPTVRWGFTPTELSGSTLPASLLGQQRTLFEHDDLTCGTLVKHCRDQRHNPHANIWAGLKSATRPTAGSNLRFNCVTIRTVGVYSHRIIGFNPCSFVGRAAAHTLRTRCQHMAW